VEELQSRMSWREFVFWQARYLAEPFGTEWENIRSAAVSANVCSIWAKGQKIQDHIPRKKRKRQTVQAQYAVFQSVKAGVK
jgi:hypothetical protein